MKATLLALTLLITASICGQDTNRLVFDSLKSQEVIMGYCDRDFLENLHPFNLYYADDYRDYNPKLPEPDSMLQLLNDISITIVLGTWCSDSKEQIPRFFKVLDMAGFPSDSVQLIGVDGMKKATGIDIDWLRIERVPTFFFFRNGELLGRIIEIPEISLEKDMLEIVGN